MIPPVPPPTPQNSPAVQEVRHFQKAAPHPSPLGVSQNTLCLGDHRVRSVNGLTILSPASAKTAEKGEGIANRNRGYDIENLDPSIDPSKDFYRYAVGGWLKNNPEPPKGYGIWGTFRALDKATRDNVLTLLEEGATQADPDLKKGRAFFQSYLNMEKRDEAGLKPLQPFLDQIVGLDSREALFEQWTQLKLMGTGAFCSTGADGHPFRARHNIFTFSEGGTNLGDHDMYLPERDTAENGHEKIRGQYRDYVEKIWGRLGVEETSPSQAADAVLRIETELARVRWTKEERREPDLTANVYTLEQLKEMEPNFPFEQLFAALGASPVDVRVSNPRFVQCLARLFREAALEDLKAYLAFCLINASAPYLDTWFEKTHFDFYQGVLSGIKDQKPLAERAAEASSKMLGEAIGKAYARRWFPAHRKALVQRMVEGIKDALVTQIQNLNWMGPETKERAIEKVQATVVQVGYPDEGKWIDYSTLAMDADQPLINNVIACWRFAERQDLKEVEKPIDMGKWPWPPQTVNACNCASLNLLNFPAGILQYPFVADDEPVTWGAFGAVIAHEIIHSFDDKGRKYGKDGRKDDWWTPEDGAKFEAHGKVLADYFDNLSVSFSDGTSISVRGEMCLGENIADLGGLTVAYQAFEKAWEGRFTEVEKGFTPQQRFFLAWAQVWATTALEDEAKRRLSWDVHSPPQWRVNGPLAQLPAFWAAFDVPEGAEMRVEPEKVCRMWLP